MITWYKNTAFYILILLLSCILFIMGYIIFTMNKRYDIDRKQNIELCKSINSELFEYENKYYCMTNNSRVLILLPIEMLEGNNKNNE